jgi:hypothetical protein
MAIACCATMMDVCSFDFVGPSGSSDETSCATAPSSWTAASSSAGAGDPCGQAATAVLAALPAFSKVTMRGFSVACCAGEICPA